MSMRCVFLLALAVAVLADDSKPAKKTYELPEDGKAVVLSIDLVGGYGPARGKDEPPVFALRADGTVVGAGLPKGAKLDAREVQSLLRFAIGKHRILEYDRKRVDAQIKAAQEKDGERAHVRDAADTVLKVAIKGKERTVRVYASTWMAQQYPKVKELQSLEAIRRRLFSTLCVMQIGGEARAKELLAVANAALKKEHPKAGPLTLDDLHRYTPGKKGAHTLQVIRWAPRATVGVWLTIPEEGKPEVRSVTVEPR